MEEEKKDSRSNYINSYRKQHYKQLNVDVPIHMMKQLDILLKQKKITRTQFVIDKIYKFLEENEKNKK